VTASVAPSHVALLRGINVGGRTARKEELVRAVSAVGVDGVHTFLASGNVLFRTSPGADPVALETAITAALAAECGFEAASFVRDARQMATVVGRTAFPTAPPGAGTLQVGFVHTAFRPPARATVVSLTTGVDRLAVVGREVYWHTTAGVSDSPLFKGSTLARAVGQDVTWRNMNTVRRLSERLGT
jgi:uncharacterized protein (DUF1697 family)